MQNNNYLHLEFMGINELALDSFSEALRKKIKLFGMMLPGIDETVGTDALVLRDKLDKLDKEIYGDMLEEYEEYLENNEVTEIPEGVAGTKTDKDLLEQLWNIGRKKGLRRSTLRNMGFRGELSGNRVNIGAFRLERTGIFVHTYDLVKTR
ncbi:hypothetical protein JMN32_08825 [Fulvivirga sp. 29W222]|uniref:Uncharacterized protein n=1 Tax=Fulvivirga marina TaxID=2494733 RepID=A0A937FUY1_9BACT|nr:hypothetical protein [Fulvivirga marina]MBL6446409.1 hypothetical protein [Fulvivirga marina]